MDTKIQAQLEKECEGEQDGRGQRQCLGKKNKKWPVWPALSLEHVAADEARIKRGKKRTPRERPGPRRSSFEEPGVLYLYALISSLGQNKLSTRNEREQTRS